MRDYLDQRSKSDRHDWKMRNQISRVEKCSTGKYGTEKCRTKCRTGKCRTKNAGVENAGPENAGPENEILEIARLENVGP